MIIIIIIIILIILILIIIAVITILITNTFIILSSCSQNNFYLIQWRWRDSIEAVILICRENYIREWLHGITVVMFNF